MVEPLFFEPELVEPSLALVGNSPISASGCPEDAPVAHGRRSSTTLCGGEPWRYTRYWSAGEGVSTRRK